MNQPPFIPPPQNGKGYCMFCWKFMITRGGERRRERERRKESKTQPGFALFGISRATQQPGEKGYNISVHLRPESTMAPKHTMGALETHPAPTMGP